MQKYFTEQHKRVVAAKHEEKRRFWLSIVKNQFLPLSVRFVFYKKLRSTRSFSFGKLKNRCYYTNRSRSVVRFFKMSRIVFRNFALSGGLPGVKKSSW